MVNLHGEPQSREDAKKEDLRINPFTFASLRLCGQLSER
jgi:hypothetical protein